MRDNLRSYSSLSSLIVTVQNALPDWIILALSTNEFEGEPFHIKINEIFIPLSYDNPVVTINDLIDHLHCYSRYEKGLTIFPSAKIFTRHDYVKLEASVLYEILSNLADTPLAIFISKVEWYVDVSGSGPFFPLSNISASEFLDYVADIVWGRRIY